MQNKKSRACRVRYDVLDKSRLSRKSSGCSTLRAWGVLKQRTNTVQSNLNRFNVYPSAAATLLLCWNTKPWQNVLDCGGVIYRDAAPITFKISRLCASFCPQVTDRWKLWCSPRHFCDELLHRLFTGIYLFVKLWESYRLTYRWWKVSIFL